MAFRFKFKTLQNVRKIQENIALHAFSQAQKQLHALMAMKTQVENRRDVLRAELMTLMKAGMSSVDVKRYYDYLAHLERGIELIIENIEKAQRRVDEKREELIKAKRAHKAIVRLREIHLARYDEAERKRDMLFLDEIAIRNAGGE